jgi:hypothetical protein
MDRLSEGLAKLAGKVHAEVKTSNSRKAADWQTVQDNYPDHAQFITDFTSVFGKPASVKVTATDGDVILDSRRYGS